MSELALEGALFLVPYNEMKKWFQKSKNYVHLQDESIRKFMSNFDAMLKREGTSSLTVADKIALLKELYERLEGLHQTTSKYMDLEWNSLEKLTANVDYMKLGLPSNDSNSNELCEDWRRARLNRAIVDHLLREKKYLKTARLLAYDAKVHEFINFGTYQLLREIEAEIADQNYKPLVTWLKENRHNPQLAETNLEFKVHIRIFCDLILENKRNLAFDYAQAEIKSFQADFEELRQYMNLLSEPYDQLPERYKPLLNAYSWPDLRNEFRKIYYIVMGMPSESVLSAIMQAGLAAFKTPQCHTIFQQSKDCPVCQSDFNRIAMELPYAHFDRTRLLCRVTNTEINEGNPAVMLPNGQVYGESAIPLISKEDGYVICPTMNNKFLKRDIQRCYIL